MDEVHRLCDGAIAGLEARLGKLMPCLGELMDACAGLSSKLAAMGREIARLQGARGRAEEEIAGKEESIVQLKAALQGSRAETEERDAIVARGEAALERCKAQIADKEGTLAHFQTLLDADQMERAKVQREMAGLHAQLEKCRVDVAERDSKLSQLQAALATSKTKLSLHKTKYKTALEDHESCDKRLQESQRETEEATIQLTQALQELEVPVEMMQDTRMPMQMHWCILSINCASGPRALLLDADLQTDATSTDVSRSSEECMQNA